MASAQISALTPVQPGRPGWQFWAAWVLASIGAVGVYIILMILLSPLMAQRRTSDMGLGPMPISIVWFLLSSLLMGALIGLGQWLVLRMHVPSVWWIAATMVGYALPLLAGPAGMRAFPAEAPPWVPMTIMILEFGLLLGVLQWLVLRGRVHHAGWWVPITLSGWGLGFALSGAAILTGLYVEPMDMLFAFLVPVAVGGRGLVWLLRPAAGA